MAGVPSPGLAGRSAAVRQSTRTKGGLTPPPVPASTNFPACIHFARPRPRCDSGKPSKRRHIMAVFSDAFLRLRQDLDRSHESRRKLIQDIRANVRDMARQTTDQLAEAGPEPPRRIHGDDHRPPRRDPAASRADAGPTRRTLRRSAPGRRGLRQPATRPQARHAKPIATLQGGHPCELYIKEATVTCCPPNRKAAESQVWPEPSDELRAHRATRRTRGAGLRATCGPAIRSISPGRPAPARPRWPCTWPPGCASP